MSHKIIFYYYFYLFPFPFLLLLLLIQFWGCHFNIFNTNISPSVPPFINTTRTFSVLDHGLGFYQIKKRMRFQFFYYHKTILFLNMVRLGESIGDRWMNKESLVWLVYTICLAIPLFLSFSLHSFASYPLFWGISLFILQKLFKFPSLFCALFSLHWSKDFWDFC